MMTAPLAPADAAPEAGPTAPRATQPHAHPADAVLAGLAVDAATGLDAEQVRRRQAQHGPNRLAEVPPTPWWRQFLDQFNETVVWLLLAAAVVAGVLKGPFDAAAILAIVVLNAVLGFVQQMRAERALRALQQMSAPTAKVVRDGGLQVIPAADLVPGDRVELEAGDHVPADARLLAGFGLQVQEAALTGESAPVGKEPAAALDPDTPLGDRRTMAYAGTVVVTGKASAVVVATGMGTELGRVAGLMQGAEAEPTPLQKRLTHLGRVLVALCLGAVGVIFALHLARGGAVADALVLAVSLAVAAVPEGLPAVVTITLALGVQRMVRRNALIRRLAGVETLGSVTVICSDKTGTLTRNEMTVREVWAGGTWYDVTGAGYHPDGQFSRRDDQGAVAPAGQRDLIAVLQAGWRCNHARLTPAGGAWAVVGDPTEGALLVAARKAGLGTTPDDARIVAEVPFDSTRKAMSVAVREPDGSIVLYTKGAPEVVLSRCTTLRKLGVTVPLSDDDRAAVLGAAADMAGRALRVLALAHRPMNGAADVDERDLVFAGLVGMIDPPREEAKAAIRTCHEAGVRAVMITGDHPATAGAIARDLGLTADGAGQVLTGRDLDALTDDGLAAQVDAVAVYARVSAEHKLRVVRALQARGHVVTMTGDGVNDAPAVKAADIGVGMGVTGTDVTKEAATMVLRDDNFATIVAAVEEGRGIFDNLRKFVAYLLAGNAGKLLTVFAAGVLGWDAPLLAIQLLWLNLVTDGLPALALGLETAERDVMRRPPRPPQEPLLPGPVWGRILGHGALAAAAALAGFWLTYQGDPARLGAARVVAFCVLGFGQLAYSLTCRSPRATALELGLFSNPALLGAIGLSGLLQAAAVLLPPAHALFGIEAAPTPGSWALIAALAVAPAALIEGGKWLTARLRPA